MGSIIAEVAAHDGLRLWVTVPADKNDEALEIDGSTGIVTRTVLGSATITLHVYSNLPF
jgi:hypothetical protein